MDQLYTQLALWEVDIFIQKQVFGNTLRDYLITIGIIIAFILFFYGLRFVITKWLKQLVKKSVYKTDDFVVELVQKNIKWQAIMALSINIAMRKLVLSDFVFGVVDWITIIIIAYFVIRIINDIIKFVINNKINDLKEQDRVEDTAILRTIKQVIIAIVWVMGGIVLLQTRGVDVSALVAGVGVGGIAIAFALQNILEDIFSSVSLFFDKPFKVGETIKVGEETGTVENIGTKTSRIRTLRGEQLSIPNKVLTQSNINNFSRLSRRRVELKFGIIYETPLEKVKKVKEIVKDILESIEDVTFDRVHFKELGDYSLNFVTVFHIEVSSFERNMDIKDEFNFRLMEEFEKAGIEFAYPTQAVVSHDDLHLDMKSI